MNALEDAFGNPIPRWATWAHYFPVKSYRLGPSGLTPEYIPYALRVPKLKRVLIVGQAPSRTSDPREPFSGRSGARLVAYSGLDREKFWALVDASNLLAYWPGQTQPKGDDFSIPEARTAAIALADRIAARRPRYSLVLLAGRKVAEAFGYEWLDWFETYGEDPRFTVIPHPSGANYWWNQPANVELAQRKLREWIR